MKQRKIIHVDMDCFYAAIEVRDNPELRGKPVAVGGQANSRGVLCTCNYEARKFGIHSAMPSSQAKRLCPQLIIVDVNFDKYIAVSEAIHGVFKRYTSLVEPLSLDEAYLDVSHSTRHAGSATLIAQELRQEIFNSQQLTASAGIGPNKMLAKIASDWNKPNGQFVIPPKQVANFMHDLPVKKLYGVGKVTAEKLQQLNIQTCADIQKRSASEMSALFGSYGQQLYQMAFGIDNRELVTERKRKSLSVETTFASDYPAHKVPEATLNAIFSELKNRLKKSEKTESDIKTIFIKIKYSDFTATTAQSACQRFSATIFNQLFKIRTLNEKKAIRLIGFGVHFDDNLHAGKRNQLAFDFS